MDDASVGGAEAQNWAACGICDRWRRVVHSVDAAQFFSCACAGRECSETCDWCQQHECVCPSDDYALLDGDVRDGSEVLVSDDDLRALSAHRVARRFGKDVRNWKEAWLRTYKERIDEAYPEGFPTATQYDGLRERYEKLEIELERLRLRKIATRRATRRARR